MENGISLKFGNARGRMDYEINTLNESSPLCKNVLFFEKIHSSNDRM